jgi:5-methylcytosine-specific restriction endonuclease McrA
LAYALDNLQSLCRACHAAKTTWERRTYGKASA